MTTKKQSQPSIEQEIDECLFLTFLFLVIIVDFKYFCFLLLYFFLIRLVKKVKLNSKC
jgi:hypothetical protein